MRCFFFSILVCSLIAGLSAAPGAKMETVWELGPEELPGPVDRLTLGSGILFAGGPRWFRAYEADSGKQLWDYLVVRFKHRREVRSAEPAGDSVFLGGAVESDRAAGWLWRHEARTGKSEWEQGPLALPGPVAAIRADGDCVFAGGGGTLDAFGKPVETAGWIGCYRIATGAKVWEQADCNLMRPVRAVAVGETKVLAAGLHWLAAFDRATGELSWETALEDGRRIEALDIRGNRVRVAGAVATPPQDDEKKFSGWIGSYDLESGKELAVRLLDPFPGPVRAFRFQDDQLAVAGVRTEPAEGWLSLFNAETGRKLDDRKPGKESDSFAAFLFAGDRIFLGGRRLGCYR